MGGLGRSIYYRPKRYRPRSLAGQLPTRLRVGDTEVHLYDLSMSGLAYHLTTPASAPSKGSILPVELSIRDVIAFSGRGEVVRTEEGNRRTKVAVRLINSLLEPSKLATLHDRLVFEDAMERGLAVFDDVPVSYKVACSDAALFLNHWRSLLDSREAKLLRGSSMSDSKRMLEIEAAAEARMRAEWTSLRQRANGAALDVLGAQPGIVTASKRLTELQLTPLLLSAPIWNRAYRKPLGYPGDYRLMNYMYDSDREGETAFARIMHQLGREERLAETVSARKNLLIRHLRDAMREGGGDESPVRITSIGSGPAREVEEFLGSDALRSPAVFSLIDQDEKALEFANRRILNVGISHGEKLACRCRYASFGQLLAQPDLLTEIGDQHLIYSAGLLDYLSEPVARNLVRQLFGLLRPNGWLLLGNAADEPGIRWVPDFVLDWHMTYRTEDELRSLAADLSAPAKIQIERDSSHTWFFLVIRRI